jgi:hypothetical protein
VKFLGRQRFIAFSAGEFKQILRGIESGSRMIYNESNNKKAASATSFLLFSGMTQTKRATQLLDSPSRIKTSIGRDGWYD